MKKQNEKRTVVIAGLIMTVFMLLLHILTKYTADDYCYHYNLADGTRVTNLAEIFKALYDHYIVHSGRVFAHFFVYLFLLLPKGIFNVAGAVVFVTQIGLIYKIARGDREHNVFVFLLTFALIWIYEPTFGQINLWLTGACNYLFGFFFSLLYLYSFIGEKKTDSVWSAVGWCLFSFMFGGYSENMSFCVAAGAFLILLWDWIAEKKKVRLLPLLKIGFAAGGYLFMVFAPSTLVRQTGTFSVSEYVMNFKNMMYRHYELFYVLLFMWMALLVAAFYLQVERRWIFLSAVCYFISITSTLMLFVASYKTDRSLAGSLVYLVLADMILVYRVWDSKYQIAVAAMMACIGLMTAVMLVVGIHDIMWTYSKTVRREAQILECVRNGGQEVYVDEVAAYTKYSSSYRLPDLDAEDPLAYPNTDYEKYYGIERILLKEAEPELDTEE